MIHRTIHKKLKSEMQQEERDIVLYYGKQWLPALPVALLIAGMLWLRFLHPTGDNSVPLARSLGVDVNSLVDANRLYEASARTHTLYEQDFARAQKLLTSSSPVIRARAVLIFTNCTDPAVKSKAIAIVRGAASDPDGAVRYKVMNGLRQMQDPDVRSVAQQLVNDPVDYVREEAKAVLEEGSSLR